MEKRQHKIAYVTGSRADYGIVRNYLSYLNKDSEIDFSVLVTGSHMDDHFGKTVSIIENDGFKIDLKVNLNIDTNSTAAILNSMSIAIQKFGCYFENYKYDLLIILGDRYEMMAVAQAAAMQRIPILHLHGGEVTYGNYDEFIRHCITKMSRYHFASTEVYRDRIIQMGESPGSVFNMGARRLPDHEAHPRRTRRAVAHGDVRAHRRRPGRGVSDGAGYVAGGRRSLCAQGQAGALSADRHDQLRGRAQGDRDHDGTDSGDPRLSGRPVQPAGQPL